MRRKPKAVLNFMVSAPGKTLRTFSYRKNQPTKIILFTNTVSSATVRITCFSGNFIADETGSIVQL